MNEILPIDSQFTLPDFTIVPASAGSGKTTALTQRFLQLLMSDKIPHNNLKNILAITFTNNAAAEMKQRILGYLKGAYLNNANIIHELQNLISLENDDIRRRAGELVNTILDNYSDFQVQTIDSFLARLLKISASDFGFTPDFRITLDAGSILDEALEIFVYDLAVDQTKQRILEELVHLINENRKSDDSFIWNSYAKLSEEVRNIYNFLSSSTVKPKIEDSSHQVRNLEQQILQTVRNIGDVVLKSGLDLTANYAKIIDAAKCGDFHSVINRALDKKVLKKSNEKVYESLSQQIEQMQLGLRQLVAEYFLLKSRSYYQPYLRAYFFLLETVEKVKRKRGEVYLSEATKLLVGALKEEIVPEIYFALGERIHHYLVDEFQDTSPIQWTALRPLIENSLAEKGSLFLVGDTKQSIYTFRGADWQIMGRMMKSQEFPSVHCLLKPLTTNWRSSEAVVEFTKKIFHEIVPQRISMEIADKSGLVSFEQNTRDDAKGRGYVEVCIYESDDDETEKTRRDPPEKSKVLEILHKCRELGYSYNNITIITPKNQHVVEISRWLNEAGIKFMSHSSLDIRTRKVTGEILALLKFLDSPVDDISFATFILGDLFKTILSQENITCNPSEIILTNRTGNVHSQPLYISLRDQYPTLWKIYFENLFNLVGYLPVYDLVSEIFKTFNVFAHISNEEASLVKFLEIINNFDESESGSLKDFLRYASNNEDSAGWNIDVSKSEDAVSVMTVHKAKGLGCDVVIALFYDGKHRPENMFLQGTGDNVRLLRVKSEWAKHNSELAKLHNERKILNRVDDLNQLYVSLTRAKEELYVVSVKTKVSAAVSSLLPPNGYKLGKISEYKHKGKEYLEEVSLLHLVTGGLKQLEKLEKLNTSEAKRGEIIHAVLSKIFYVDEYLESSIKKVIEETLLNIHEQIDIESTSKLLMDFCTLEGVREYFTQSEGRIIFNEQEIVGSDGQLYRIDRLIVDCDAVTVIDYKTGDENNSHQIQVKEYLALIKDLYPGKEVKGVLAYIDLKCTKIIS